MYSKRRSRKRSRSRMSFGVKIGKLVGEGQGGKVYLLEGTSGNKKYVVKKIDFFKEDVLVDKDEINVQIKEQFKDEIKIGIIAGELGVCPKILSYTDDSIVMEYIEGETLDNFIKKNYKNIKSLDDIKSIKKRKILEDIMKKFHKKLDILYDNGIIYTDRHGGNIMIDLKKMYI